MVKKLFPAGAIVSVLDTPAQWSTLNECFIKMREQLFEVSLSPSSYSKIVLPFKDGSLR